jgi:tripartite-type tricarboxylate transporter receptor subunit TctC
LQLVFADMPVLLQQVKGGKLRARAVGTQQRSAGLPEVATMTEAGFPKVEAYNWYALYAPAATPKPVIARLNAEVVKIMSNPDVKSFNQSQGADAMGSTPEELAALHKREYDKWAVVVKAAGIKPE